MKEKIRGGYYLKARCIQDSEIAIMPPYVREIWDWLLKEANHTEKKTNGIAIKRGQLVRTFKDIQKGLAWKIGWRTMTYEKWQCEAAMNQLKRTTMITTMKTTRGLIITICNYDFYQNPKNYDSNRRTDTLTTDQKQTTDTINNNDNNDKNVISSVKRLPSARLSDEDFIKTLNSNPAYKHINIDDELAKMDAWLLVHKGRQKTRRFIVAWFNRIDRPMGVQEKPKSKKTEVTPAPLPKFDPEQHKKVSELIHQTAQKLKVDKI